MTARPLTVEGFQDLLDRLGATLDSWPEPDRAAAESLLAASTEARERFDAARTLESRLRDGTPKAPPGLVDRIISASGATTKKS
jgi:hypothetical protein